nr:DUF1983 domain-containing protein [Allochromatium humboldtianum]
MRASVGADGTTTGLIGLKIDHSGYISGFGLSSQIINGQAVSHFVVNADMFAIGSPSRGGTHTAQYPFIVSTSTSIINGETVPAGVYMREAFIRNGSITSAKIGDAAITSAKIQSLWAGKITSGSIAVDTELRSTNYQSGVQGWMLRGDGQVEFNLAGNQFKIRDIVNGQAVTPFRVQGGVVYIDQLKVGSANLLSNAVTNVAGASANGWMPSLSLPLSEPGTQVLVIATANVFNYSPVMTEAHMNLSVGSMTGYHEVGASFDVGTAVTLTAAGIFSPSVSSPWNAAVGAFIWGRTGGGLDPGVTLGAASITAIAFKR